MDMFLLYSGQRSSWGRPAAATRVGRMSTNSTSEEENSDWGAKMMTLSVLFTTIFYTSSISPGTCSIMGALWEISKLLYFIHSVCSPICNGTPVINRCSVPWYPHLV